MAIIIIVHPTAATAGATIIDDDAFRNFGKSSVAVILIQAIVAAIVGDKQIQIAVVVIVTPTAGPRVVSVGYDISAGDFDKSAVAIAR